MLFTPGGKRKGEIVIIHPHLGATPTIERQYEKGTVLKRTGFSDRGSTRAHLASYYHPPIDLTDTDAAVDAFSPDPTKNKLFIATSKK
jgi:hypothetical protein